MPTISGTITADELKQLWMFSFPYSRSSWLLADVFYRRVTMPPLGMLGLPSGGVLALLLASFVFLTALVFAARPFYRLHLGYGSPPLAIRSGLLAFACIQLFIALTGKVDLVTMLTGISYEKLDVLHQWVACFGFGPNIAHQFPSSWPLTKMEDMPGSNQSSMPKASRVKTR